MVSLLSVPAFFQTDLCTIWPCPGHLSLWLHVFNKKFALALWKQELFIGSKSFHFSSTVSTLALTISVIWWKPILKRCLSRTGAGALLCSWPVHPSSRICLKRFQTRLNLVLPWCILMSHDLAQTNLKKIFILHFLAGDSCQFVSWSASWTSWPVEVKCFLSHISHWFSINHVTFTHMKWTSPPNVSKRWMPVGEAGYVYHFPLQWGEVCFYVVAIYDIAIVSGFKTSSCP